jgi:hypothetical protein
MLELLCKLAIFCSWLWDGESGGKIAVGQNAVGGRLFSIELQGEV